MLDPLELVDCSGRPTTLDPARSLLVFYRGFWCEHCRGQFVELANLAPAFRQSGVRIVAISADSAVLAEAMCSLAGGRIAVYRDADAANIRQYGLADRDEAVAHVIARPAAFIVGDDRAIAYRYVGRTAEDRPAGELLLLGAESMAMTYRG
jgi:peroxiredoxin